MSTVLDPVKNQESKQDNGNSFMAQVQVFDDEKFPLEVVLAAFCTVLPGYDVEKALAKARDIEANGSSVVWSGPREVCELYSEQLNGYGVDAQVV